MKRRRILQVSALGAAGALMSAGFSQARLNKETGSPPIPYIKGMFQHVLYPPGQRDAQKTKPKERWYINDHCFFVDKDDTIHWYGITNPYPPKGKSFYGAGSHRHIGHASAKSPFGPWQEHAHAFALPEDTSDCIGACYVVRHKDEYLMLYGYASGFKTGRSSDLHNWETIEDREKITFGQGTRDPCILQIAPDEYLLYAVRGEEGMSAVGVMSSSNLLDWKIEPSALISDFPGSGGLLESPFVLEHEEWHYLFLNHSHHQYQETLVFVSKDPRHFDWKSPQTTLFGHASEFFTWKGKIYISHCGIEDKHWRDKTGLYLAELSWAAGG
jgi:hypothetical protein